MTRSTGKRTAWLLAVCAIGVLAFGLAASQLTASARAKRFVDHWAVLLSRCNSLEDLRSIPDTERPDLIWTRKFSSGDWVAVRMEHSCCSGAGFDASVFVDNTGTVRFDTTHSFCGYEGLCGELDSVAANDLAGFYGGLSNLALKTWKRY